MGSTDVQAAARLESALVDPALADRVEMVVRPLGESRYRAASHDGAVEFERLDADGVPEYRVLASEGSDPLANQSTDHLVGHAVEREGVHPRRADNAHPHAFDSIAQFFDASHAPDLVATHTAAHHVDGHHGQHGSLGVVQARAPFIAAGAGVRNHGVVDRSTRVVHVAPTAAALLGVDPHPLSVGPLGSPRPGGLLRRQDGDVETNVLDGEVARHVVVFLLDGCNANLLHEVIDSGEAPNLATLVERGTSYRHGSMASLPTATLANHTTALTGAHPGHSGVLHNTWHDRSSGATPDLLDLRQMFWSGSHVADDVETLFEAVARSRPGAVTSATFEFCDRGASFSSFGLARSGSVSALPAFEEVDHVDADSAAASEQYRFMSAVDHLSTQHTVSMWNGDHGDVLPDLSWCSLALTDEAGHESGPHGELARAAVRDSDARIGVVLAAVERAGALDDTAVLVIADHGMEQSDPDVDAGWSDELAATGVPHREVGGGLIYVG